LATLQSSGFSPHPAGAPLGQEVSQTEFAQFLLFRELANAYRQSVENRIQLVLDFEPVGAIDECFEPLKCGRIMRTRSLSLRRISRDSPEQTRTWVTFNEIDGRSAVEGFRSDIRSRRAVERE
jgi:hypothetical protein